MAMNKTHKIFRRDIDYIDSRTSTVRFSFIFIFFRVILFIVLYLEMIFILFLLLSLVSSLENIKYLVTKFNDES